MKKLLSLALSLALLGGMTAPASAVDAASAEARLSAVTSAVKKRLDLDTTGYDSFHGDLEEGTLIPTWDLYWEGGDGSLSVTCTEQGRILSYRNGARETTPYSGAFSPAFPAVSREEAQRTALAFLERALIEGVEQAVIDEVDGRGGLSSATQGFTGEIYLNGLPSPLRFNIFIGADDNQVRSFHTYGGDYTSYLGDIPSPAPAAERNEAAAALKETLNLRLEYVRDGDMAVLRYLPEIDAHSYYVDGRTGALVDLTQAYEEAGRNGLYASGGAADMEAGPSASAAPESLDRLTQAEQAGVEQMEGVLDKGELDAHARKITALGLGGYGFASAAYQLNPETGEVSARLQYARQDGEDMVRRLVTLDGKTGALLAVSTSGVWRDEPGHITLEAAQKTAGEFLKEVCGGDFAKTELYESAPAEKNADHSFDFAQKENGYFFPENTLHVSIDSADGTVARYSRSFEDVKFQSAGDLVDLETARSAWYGTYDVTLEYLAVPQRLDPSAPEYRPLLDAGLQYLYALKLAYALERQEAYLGVDAATGTAVPDESRREEIVAYDDLEGSWAREALEALAFYGVGWLGGKAGPGMELTQRDLVALLVSTHESAVDPGQLDEAAADRLYERAYQYGILTSGARADDKVMSRIETVKLLLDSVGFGEAARLQGIYRSAFTDAADIPAEWYGYAALAQGLGIAKGDKRGNLNPNRAATRGDAAVMLYNFMARPS